jgi:hypothetical protein
VSVEVRVDLDSAVVVYRPAVGEERASPVKQVSLSDLFHAASWRTFRWYYGQRHYSGLVLVGDDRKFNHTRAAGLLLRDLPRWDQALYDPSASRNVLGAPKVTRSASTSARDATNAMSDAAKNF